MVQEVLLYGLEMWFIYPYIGGNMGGFHHRVVHRLMGVAAEEEEDGWDMFLPPTGGGNV